MCHKSEGTCGLWVLNEITLKQYAESLKKTVGAFWELPAKEHSQSSQPYVEMGWMGYVI